MEPEQLAFRTVMPSEQMSGGGAKWRAARKQKERLEAENNETTAKDAIERMSE
jgi:hypothetical protein